MEARESQDLFNQVADVIDFTPEVFDQTLWGSTLTLEMFKDSNGVEENAVHYYHEDEDDIKFTADLGDTSMKSLECGTSCCVAGWVALFNGWHPTITEFNSGQYAETWEARMRRQEGDDRYLVNAEHRIFELDHAFVADRPGVRNEGWNWTDARGWHDGVLVLEDGVTEVARVDILAQRLLGLSMDEASKLFDAGQKWEGEDLRLMGKGEDILDMGIDSGNQNQYGIRLGDE